MTTCGINEKISCIPSAMSIHFWIRGLPEVAGLDNGGRNGYIFMT